MINTHLLKLPLSRTYLHGPKGVRAIEVLLYVITNLFITILLRHPALSLCKITHHKDLAVYLSNDCTWHHHINYIKETASFRINIVRRFKFQVDRKSLRVIYTEFIRPILEYSDVIWDNYRVRKNDLDKLQNEAARIATGAIKLVSLNALSKEICWMSFKQRRKNHYITLITLFYKMF